MAIATKSLVWKGEALTAQMRAAQIAGVNKVMGACVVYAKSNHPWQNRTGLLEGAIAVVDYAAPDEGGVKGVWGVQDAVQARILEEGGTIVPVKAKALRFQLPDGRWVFAHQVTIAPHPYLRPAGDACYPSLPAAIRAAYNKSGPVETGGSDG